MLPAIEASSKSFRDLVDHFDDDDFMQYFTPNEIPEEVQTLLHTHRTMEDKIRYLTMEEEFDNYRIFSCKIKYDEQVRLNEELTRRTAESVELMKTMQAIEEILLPMFLDLRYEVFPSMLETANKLKAAKEAWQKEINEERDRAFEQLSEVKKIRLIDTEIAKIDLEIAETLTTNKKMEQQYQQDIIQLAKMWKKQQDDELAAAALLIEEVNLTPSPLFRHFDFSPVSSPEVAPPLPMEVEIPFRSSNVSTNKCVRFSQDTKTADASLPSVVKKQAFKRNIKQSKSRANGNSSQAPFFASYTSEENVEAPIFSQTQPSFSISPDHSFSGRMSAKKLMNGQDPSTSGDQHGHSTSQDRSSDKTSSADFRFFDSGNDDNATKTKDGKSGIFDY